MIRAAIGVVTGLVLVGAAAAAPSAPDPEAAERAYRAARRLVAQGSAEAREALDEVVRLDPAGELADDALCDLARMEALPLWPEQIGALGLPGARSALGRLDRVVAEMPRADRADEARYLRALIRLEPLPGYDLSAARLDLTSVATARPAGAWALRARYALAWLHEAEGAAGRALATYRRLIVDGAPPDIEKRAHVAAARLALRGGDAVSAAAWSAQAIRDGATVEDGAFAMREASVRELLRRFASRSRVGAAPPHRVPVGVRSPAAFLTLPDGGVAVADRREGRVVRHDRRGAPVGVWALDEPEALAVDGRGTIVAASGDHLYRLERGGTARRFAALGPFAPAAGLAVDGTGSVWVLPRRGQSIGVVRPGASSTATLWEDRDRRLVGLVWNGSRLISIATRSRSLVTFLPDEGLRATHTDELAKWNAVAIGPAGEIAALDERTRSVVVFSAGHADTVDLESQGIVRPRGLGFGPDGALHLYDEADGSWVRFP